MLYTSNRQKIYFFTILREVERRARVWEGERGKLFIFLPFHGFFCSLTVQCLYVWHTRHTTSSEKFCYLKKNSFGGEREENCARNFSYGGQKSSSQFISSILHGCCLRFVNFNRDENSQRFENWKCALVKWKFIFLIVVRKWKEINLGESASRKIYLNGFGGNNRKLH